MDKEVARVEKIELYIKNQLQGEELQHFERQLKYDPILQNQIDLQKAILESLEIHGDKELLKTLDSHFDDYQKNKSMSESKLKKYLYGSGIFLVFILSIVLVLTNDKKDYSDVVAAENAKEQLTLSETTNGTIHIGEKNNIVEVLEDENEEILVPDRLEPKEVVDKESDRHFKALKSFDLPVTVITTQNSPKYKFDNSTLQICGLNGVSTAQLHLVQHNHDLFLHHGKTYYKIKLAHEFEVLETVSTPQQHNVLQHATGKGIVVQMIKTKTVQLEDTEELKFHVLEVRDLLEENNTKYKFIGKELVINENLYNKLNDNFRIYYIEKTDEYYLRFKKRYYHLDHNNQEFTELNEEANHNTLQYFEEDVDKKVIKYLKLEDIEGMYNSF